MKVIPLTIGAWNVRTLMDSAGSDRPQWRTVLVGRELDRYRVEIAALNETRLAEEGLLKEVGAGYTFFWAQERRAAWSRSRIRHQVKPRQQALNTSKRHKWPPDDAETSLIWQKACNNCKCLCTYNDQKRVREKSRECHSHKPQPFSDTKRKRKPTKPNKHKSNKRKDKFYDVLDSVISTAAWTAELILLGDFSARVGTDDQKR